MDAGEGEVVVVFDDGVEVAVGRLGDHPVDLALVDTLARLHLALLRTGASLVLRRPSRELCELLDLVGLAGVIRGAGLTLDAGGEPEDLEQLGVEEVVPGGDLPA